MRRESRAAHSELVGLATDVMGLIQRAQWTGEKGATLNSTPFRVNFIQKLRAWLLPHPHPRRLEDSQMIC